MNNLQKAFLFTSCVSAFGDALLYLALPVGLGLTTGKVEDAITLFLIPAIFMFASSYVSERFVRPKRLNLDYGYVLISLALIELIISVLCILAEGITEKKYLMYKKREGFLHPFLNDFLMIFGAIFQVKINEKPIKKI